MDYLIIGALALIPIALLVYFVRPAQEEEWSAPVSIEEDFYHLMNWNGLPMNRRTAAASMSDPENADLVREVAYATPEQRRVWRERISVVDARPRGECSND